MANELDSLFKQYAEKAEAEAKAAKNTSYSPRDYDIVKYCGLELNKPTIIRAVSGPPNSAIDDSTARTVTLAKLIGDDGKKFRVVRPSITADPSYILNRIILRVRQVKWNNGVKTYPVEEQCPEIFNIIDKNGVKKNDPKLKFEKGWLGKELLVMNVIDRSQMDWHKENKHTMLLAKSVGEFNGSDYVDILDEGISAAAAEVKLNQLFKYYGSWEKYDLAITRTGDKNNAYNITNATKNPETVDDESIAKFISMEDHLTDEEKSWERYDLTKLFRVTTSTKIYNRLKVTIARIDAALNTHFLTELEQEVEAEKKMFDELYGKEDESNSLSESTVNEEAEIEKEPVKETTSTTVPETKTRTRTASANTGKEWQKLPFGSTLSDELKAKVKSVTKKSDGKYDIEWDCPVDELAACPNDKCEAIAPLSASKCPACGLDF